MACGRDLARHGLFFDLYTTSTYQDVTSGGLKTGSSFVQNIQTSVNIDTARAGLWSGGLIHVTAQSRYGDPPEETFTAGTIVPQYTGLVEPDPLLSHETNLSEYFLVQALSKTTSVVLGKISDVFIPDQTMIGDSYKYYFANFNFNKNPMTTNFYHPTASAGTRRMGADEELCTGGRGCRSKQPVKQLREGRLRYGQSLPPAHLFILDRRSTGSIFAFSELV